MQRPSLLAAAWIPAKVRPPARPGATRCRPSAAGWPALADPLAGAPARGTSRRNADRRHIGPRIVPALAPLTRKSGLCSNGAGGKFELRQRARFRRYQAAPAPKEGAGHRGGPHPFPGDLLCSISLCSVSPLSHWQSNSDSFSRPTSDLVQTPARCRARRKVNPVGWRRLIGPFRYDCGHDRRTKKEDPVMAAPVPTPPCWSSRIVQPSPVAPLLS